MDGGERRGAGILPSIWICFSRVNDLHAKLIFFHADAGTLTTVKWIRNGQTQSSGSRRGTLSQFSCLCSGSTVPRMFTTGQKERPNHTPIHHAGRGEEEELCHAQLYCQVSTPVRVNCFACDRAGREKPMMKNYACHSDNKSPRLPRNTQLSSLFQKTSIYMEHISMFS